MKPLATIQKATRRFSRSFVPDAALLQYLRGRHQQSAVQGAQRLDVVGLHGRDTRDLLQVGQVRLQLGQLALEMG